MFLFIVELLGWMYLQLWVNVVFHNHTAQGSGILRRLGGGAGGGLGGLGLVGLDNGLGVRPVAAACSSA